MTPEEFRKRGRQVVDWIADYMEGVESLPVLSRVRARRDPRGACRRRRPSAGEPFEAMLAIVDRILLPGITHWQSPNFFAYFPANNSGPSILGELLSAGSACRACSGPPARRAPSWRRTCSTGWSRCSACPATFRSRLGRGRGHPGHRVERDARAPCWRPGSGRPTRRERNRRRATEAHRLRLHAGALLVEKAVKIAGIGTREPPADRCRRAVRHAPGRARGGDSEDRRRREDAVLRLRHRRYDLVERHRPRAGDRRDLPATTASGSTSTRRCAARRRSARSSGGSTTASISPTATASTRTSGCSRTSTATLLGRGPRGPDPRAERASRVPEEQGDGVGRGHRLPRLADPAGPAVPRPEALVRDPPLRRRGTASYVRQHVALAQEFRSWVERAPRASSWPRPRR